MKKILPDEGLLQKIRCPICRATVMIQDGRENGGSVSLYCEGARRHCFDFSSGGYVNLMPPGHASGGDSKQAVRARTDFLNLGHYLPVAEALRDAMAELLSPKDRFVIDAGCGEGYYTSILGEAGYTVSGIDLSKFAVDATAKRVSSKGLETGFFSVASVFELPFFDGCADGIVNVFAPCAEEEFCRVLRTGGILAVAYAGPEHLMGLKQAIYDETRENDGRADLPTQMELIKEIRVSYDTTVRTQSAIENLFAMTPYYWRTSPSDCEKLKHFEELKTAVDVIIAFYRKR